MGFQREDRWPRQGNPRAWPLTWLPGSPVQACACPLFCPPGPTGQASLLLLLITVTSLPRARLHRSGSCPRELALRMSLGSPSVSLTGREWGLGGAPHSQSNAHPFQGGCPPSPAAARPCCQGSGVPPGPHLPPGWRKPVCRGKGRGNSVGGRLTPTATSHLGQLPGPGPPSTSVL